MTAVVPAVSPLRPVVVTAALGVAAERVMEDRVTQDAELAWDNEVTQRHGDTGGGVGGFGDTGGDVGGFGVTGGDVGGFGDTGGNVGALGTWGSFYGDMESLGRWGGRGGGTWGLWGHGKTWGSLGT